MANASEVLEDSVSSPSPKAFVLVEDLFYEILMFVGVKIEDMTWLWTTGREVSRAFKDATERVFIARHLKYTYLTANLGMHWHEGGSILYLIAKFQFSHLDTTNRTRAIFRESFVRVAQKYHKLLIDNLKLRIPSELSVRSPGMVIHIRHDANDTYIPDFESDWDKLEMKCNWVGMFSEWFKEEKQYQKESLQPGMTEITTPQDQAGGYIGFKSTAVVVKTALEGRQGLRRAIRTARIRRNVRLQWEKWGSAEGSKWVEPGTDEMGWLDLLVARRHKRYVDVPETLSDEE